MGHKNETKADKRQDGASIRSKNGANGHSRSAGQAKPETHIDPRLLQFALTGLTDGVVICDGEGRLLLFNESATAMFGQADSDKTSAEWSEHYGVYDRLGGRLLAQNELPLVRAMSGERVENLEFYSRSAARPEGLHVLCSARAIHDHENHLLGAVVICRDITARKLAIEEKERREELQSQKEFAEKKALRMAHLLQALLDHLNLVVWAIDENGIFTYHDGRGSKTVGIAPGSILGANIFELFPASEAIKKALAGIPQHETSALEGYIWENWYVPIRDHTSDKWHVIGLSLDVTEAHRSKMELESKLALIERQQTVINDLETPVIQVWDRVLTLPMVGIVDSRRAARMTDDLLRQVARTQAHFAILDLTGVEVVDTATAGHLLNIASAVRLLGAESIITGIRPNIAQTIISLGVDLTRIRTLATLRDGLALAIRSLTQGDPRKNSTKLLPFVPSDL